MTNASVKQMQNISRDLEESALRAAGEAWFFRLKSWADRLLGLVLLVPAVPVIALLIVVIRWNSRGPGVYRQVRVGKGGRIFTMYKLRSMRCDAEAKTGPAWSASGADPRVTRLGYWLRKLHLDELPQLLNVVRGEMALVGPRPERPEFVKLLAEQIPGYIDRLHVVPGITGLAQINLPPDSDLDSVRRKLIVDCQYIRTAGSWLDVRILVCTALRMVWIKGPRVTRLLGLESIAFLPTASTVEVKTDSVSLSALGGKVAAVVHRPDASAAEGDMNERHASVAAPHRQMATAQEA